MSADPIPIISPDQATESRRRAIDRIVRRRLDARGFHPLDNHTGRSLRAFGFVGFSDPLDTWMVANPQRDRPPDAHD